MKNNLKTKVMLAVLASGMLCANGAFAATNWYGTTGNKWTSAYNSAVASGLTLTIDDNTKVEGGDVSTPSIFIIGGYTGSGSSPVTGNIITFDTTKTVQADIRGGFATSQSSAAANNNQVIIEKGTYRRGNGEYGDIYGGYSTNVAANSNRVVINGGNFEGSKTTYIYGARGWTEANDNTVEINAGANFSNPSGLTIIAGQANNWGTVEIKRNKVILNGGTYGDKKVYVHGYSGLYNTVQHEGNTLHVKTKINGALAYVGQFDIMNFTLPAGIGNSDIMLKTYDLDPDGTAITINVDAAPNVSLKTDDVITLVDVSDYIRDGGSFVAGDILGGAADFYLEGATGGVDKNGDGDNNDLVIVLKQDFEQKSGGDTATTKAIAEGIAASLAFVNQGADMVAGNGIDALYVADSENPTIAAFSGNKTRYNTGRHVDIHGWNALAGVALNNKESFSHGVFVEIGNGDIDTYAALNGSGSSDYKGGGYMLRKDMGKGWTIDGAVRAGRVETSWSNNDKGGYEAKQTYYGAHVTFNKMLKEYGEQKLNGYLRYTFTHLGSDSVNLDGTHYGFDSVNSHRTRLGARMVDEGQNGFELYYGAAWEYGFGGDCDATVNGVTTSGPAVDGSNGVFEVGGTWSDNKWEISAGLEGYVGAKRGVAGGMNFIYKF